MALGTLLPRSWPSDALRNCRRTAPLSSPARPKVLPTPRNEPADRSAAAPGWARPHGFCLFNLMSRAEVPPLLSSAVGRLPLTAPRPLSQLMQIIRVSPSMR